MKRIISFIALLVIIVGCTNPQKAEEELNKLVEEQVKEQIAEMVAQTQEAIPPVFNYEIIEINNTSPNFRLNLGYCPTGHIFEEIPLNPPCVTSYRAPVFLENGEELEIPYDGDSTQFRAFCMMSGLDTGKGYVQWDTEGTGTVACAPVTEEALVWDNPEGRPPPEEEFAPAEEHWEEGQPPPEEFAPAEEHWEEGQPPPAEPAAE